jgi:hypothetical protein
MDCERFAQAKILLAHDEAGRTPELDDHLAGCAACAADVEEMRDIVRRYRQASSGAAPEALRNRLLAIRPPAIRPPLHRWVPLAAAAILLAVLAAPLLRRDSTAKPPPQVTSQTVDLSFTFESCEIVIASMPEEDSVRPIVYEAEIDRDLRELSERIVILED